MRAVNGTRLGRKLCAVIALKKKVEQYIVPYTTKIHLLSFQGALYPVRVHINVNLV